MPEQDLVIIPEHELADPKKKNKFLVKSVGTSKEKQLRKKYTCIVEVLNNLIKQRGEKQ